LCRKKLKQIEVDCETLKRCWESLTDENQRLKQELAAMQLAVGRGGGALLPSVPPGHCCDKVTVTSGGETTRAPSVIPP
jgi:hypothetical protein